MYRAEKRRKTFHGDETSFPKPWKPHETPIEGFPTFHPPGAAQSRAPSRGRRALLEGKAAREAADQGAYLRGNGRAAPSDREIRGGESSVTGGELRPPPPAVRSARSPDELTDDGVEHLWCLLARGRALLAAVCIGRVPRPGHRCSSRPFLSARADPCFLSS